MTVSLIVFITLGIIGIATAVAMVVSRNTVYSALYLVLNFLTIAIIYLIMGASFVSFAQIAVYAGAIMVLFLFVIMLLGTKQLDTEEPLKWQRPLALVFSAALAIEGIYVFITRIGNRVLTITAPVELADPKTLGLVLFQKYSLPFEITSVILLVAAIGAVVLTKNKQNGGER
jgi:NADH-quinone oxidoreductase subunit J